MSSIMDFTVQLMLNTSGNFQGEFTKAGQALSDIQRKTESLQRVVGDTSKFEALKGSITQNQSTMLDMSRAAKNLSTDIANNKLQTASLQSRYDALHSAQQKLASSGKKNTETYRRVTERMTKLKSEIQSNEREGRRLESQQKKLETGAEKLQHGLDRDREALMNLRGALNNAGVDTGKLASEQDRLQKELAESTNAQERLQKAQSRYSELQNSLKWGNIKSDIISSAGLLMTMQKPLAIDMDFEQAMAQVKAVASPSQEDFTMLRNQAMELGASTQFSATQAASTQENLARGGFTPQQIRDAMPAVLDMAAAEGMDLAQAGDIITKSLGGMGLGADQSTRLANILANMSASSSTNIAELGEAMKVVAPIASQQGVTLEQVGAYLGAMANKGFVGSEAGNVIKSAFTSLSAPTTEALNELTKYGVARKTADGKLVELPEVMRQLMKGMEKKNLGSADQLEVFKKVFGKNYGGALIAFADAAIKGQPDQFTQSNKTEAQEGVGASRRMADVRNNTLKGDITALGSAWEGLNIQIGHALEAPARYITQTLTEGISRITAFTREHETLCTWVVRIAAGFASMKVVSTVYKYGSLLVQLPFAKLSTLSAQAGVEAIATGKNFSVLSTIFGAFTSPLSAVGNAFKSLWGIIAAHPFMALFVAIELIYHNWDTLRDLGVKCAEKLSEVWQKVKDWWETWSLPDIFNPLIEKANAAFDYLAAPFIKLKDYIIDLFANFNPFNWELPSWLGGSKNMTPEQVKSRDNTRHDRAVDAMNMAFGAPSLGGYAVGGIVRTHEIAHIAESGAEAVIPLTNRSRGLEVLHQAADILGVDITPIQDQRTSSVMNMLNGQSSIMNTIRSNTQEGTILHDMAGDYAIMNTLGGDAFTSHDTLQEVRNITDDLYSGRNYDSYNNLSRSYVDNRQPQINITVNASGQDNNESLANQIANAVREAWYELQERQERLAYA